jgi:hypothetical protein
MTNDIGRWEDDGGNVGQYAPDYESLYLQDEACSNGVLSPSESINPLKVGVIDSSASGFECSCTGFMGDENLEEFHFGSTVAECITWLHARGCGKIVNIADNSVL